jgi:uncharacterized membrane protein YuzA (DUF378 family)
MDAAYLQKLAFKVAMMIVLVGALNWGLIGAFRVNLVDRIFGKGAVAAKALYIVVGLCALAIAFNRDTYLPFLGESVFPCSVLGDQVPPGATRSVQVKAEPGSKVVYWATEPGEDTGNVPDWHAAYRKYANAGVTTTDASGVAILKVREPQAYTVPFKGRLEPHIHFRVCGPTGFVGRIKTVFLADGRVEGFDDY